MFKKLRNSNLKLLFKKKSEEGGLTIFATASGDIEDELSKIGGWLSNICDEYNIELFLLMNLIEDVHASLRKEEKEIELEHFLKMCFTYLFTFI